MSEEFTLAETSAVDTAEEFLIIDIENCPGYIKDLEKHKKKYQKVIICYSQNKTKVSLSLPEIFDIFNDMYASDKLDFFQVPSEQKNAADFGISFYAGMLTQKIKKGSKITILSDDGELESVVNILKKIGFKSERIGYKFEKIGTINEGKSVKSIRTISNKNTSKDSCLSEGMKKYCKYLSKAEKGRPSKKTTLRNSIKSQIPDNKIEPDDIIQELIECKIIKVNDSKIIYDNNKLKSIIISD